MVPWNWHGCGKVHTIWAKWEGCEGIFQAGLWKPSPPQGSPLLTWLMRIRGSVEIWQTLPNGACAEICCLAVHSLGLLSPPPSTASGPLLGDCPPTAVFLPAFHFKGQPLIPSPPLPVLSAPWSHSRQQPDKGPNCTRPSKKFAAISWLGNSPAEKYLCPPGQPWPSGCPWQVTSWGQGPAFARP